MRLYSSKIGTIVHDVVKALIDQELIEVLPNNVSEVELDVESVLKEYIRAERQLTEESKDIAHSRGLNDYSAHQKIKRKLADRRGFGLYDDAIGYIANQMIETLLHTRHVEEIFGEDETCGHPSRLFSRTTCLVRTNWIEKFASVSRI